LTRQIIASILANMQAKSPSEIACVKNWNYSYGLPRKTTKQRFAQGARLSQLRKALILSQAALACPIKTTRQADKRFAACDGDERWNKS